MSDTVEKKETFEIPEKTEQKSEGQEPQKLTVEKAQEEGWSQSEIEIAKETGMIPAEPEKKEGEDQKKEPEPEKKEGEEATHEPEKKTENTHKEEKKDDFQLDEDQEKKFSEFFPKGHNVHGLYFGMKSHRTRAQMAEAERDRLLEENRSKEDRIKALEDRIQKVETSPKKEGDEDIEDDQPLTKKLLREEMARLRQEQEDQKRKVEEETQQNKNKIIKALTDQENYAKTKYEDFEKVVALGNKLLQKDPNTGKFANEVNIMSLPELQRKKALLLVRSLINASAKADEYTPSDYNAADISYELGQLHPDFSNPQEKTAGHSAEPSSNGNNPERTRGGLTPEETQRIEKNSARRNSSASVSGGSGRRFVSPEDITQDDLLQMDSKSFERFEKEHPEKFKSLMRD